MRSEHSWAGRWSLLAVRSVAVAAGAALVLSACGPGARHPVDLAALKMAAAACPGTRVVRDLSVDVSASGASEAVQVARHADLTRVVESAAVCGGSLQVRAFTGGTGATVRVLEEEDLRPEGATENARLRKVPARVEEVVGVVEAGLERAREELPRNGSDVLGQFRLAAEYGQQRGAGHGTELHMVVLTDGEQNTADLKLTPGRLKDSSNAVRLARRAPVAPLPPGTRVQLIGVGRTASAKSTTVHADALKAFYAEIGRRAEAAETLVVTDY